MVLPAIKTDLVEVTHELNSPCRFLYKKEVQQPSGSFKLRGMSELIGSAIQQAHGNTKVHVYTSSGGNAGIAAAYVSKYHGVPCTVVLPETVKQAALDKLNELNATIIIHGKHWGEADTYLRNTVMKGVPEGIEAVYCHPFDNEILWQGHGHMIDEIAQQMKEMNIVPADVKGIVCSCGGGGLYNGIVNGLERNEQLAKVPVLVIETNQTASFKGSVDAGKIITLSEINTLSTTLGAPYVCEKTWENYHSHPTVVDLVDDLDAVEATVDYFDQFDEVIEPSCGATVAISMKKRDLLKAFGPLKPSDVIIFVVCGGFVSAETMASYRALIASSPVPHL